MATIDFGEVQLPESLGEEFRQSVGEAVKNILGAIEKRYGISLAEDENFRDTPARVARAYEEILSGWDNTEEKVKVILSKTFPDKAQEMVVVGPVHVWTLCPHHLLPVELWVWLGYIPTQRVLGLSKLARLAELVARKPAMQEDATAEIVQHLLTHLAPRGAGCYIEGRHLCMAMRGVGKDTLARSTALAGVFYEKEVREEFLAMVRSSRANRQS